MNMIEWDLTLGDLSRIGSRWGRYVSYQYRRVGENGEYQYNKSVVDADGFLDSVSRNTVQPDRRLIGVGVWISTTLHSEKEVVIPKKMAQTP